MTLYAAAMLCAVIGGMVWGAWRGITWQIASIASLVIGYMVAHPLSGQISDQFPGDPLVARGLALLVCYAGVSGGVFCIAWLIRATLRRLQFEAYDRHLGMVLGGLEGGLVGIVITLFVVSLAPSSREPIFASPSGRIVGGIMQGVGPALPEEARSILKPFWDGQHRDNSPALQQVQAITKALPDLDRSLFRASDNHAGSGKTERR